MILLFLFLHNNSIANRKFIKKTRKIDGEWEVYGDVQLKDDVILLNNQENVSSSLFLTENINEEVWSIKTEIKFDKKCSLHMFLSKEFGAAFDVEKSMLPHNGIDLIICYTGEGISYNITEDNNALVEIESKLKSLKEFGTFNKLLVVTMNHNSNMLSINLNIDNKEIEIYNNVSLFLGESVWFSMSTIPSNELSNIVISSLKYTTSELKYDDIKINDKDKLVITSGSRAIDIVNNICNFERKLAEIPTSSTIQKIVSKYIIPYSNDWQTRNHLFIKYNSDVKRNFSDTVSYIQEEISGISELLIEETKEIERSIIEITKSFDKLAKNSSIDIQSPRIFGKHFFFFLVLFATEFFILTRSQYIQFAFRE